MNLHLTFDIEVWCNGWDNLDSDFPSHFERYVFGRSRHGEYALPKTLEILNQHGLKGVFFVEPLFAARFGIEHLHTIVHMILDAQQEVQLHIHPEWTDEISPPILKNIARKRQHLTYYTLEEQVALIGYAKRLLESSGSHPIKAFRAGSFAANADTFSALSANGIHFDSSLNRCYEVSGPDLRQKHEFITPFLVGDVTVFPLSVFTDGFGRERPAQVGACSGREIRDAVLDAYGMGISDFVVLSHNFEMMKPDTTEPDRVVVKRFKDLCRFLEENRAILPVVSYSNPTTLTSHINTLPKATFSSTFARHFEQLARRLV